MVRRPAVLPREGHRLGLHADVAAGLLVEPRPQRLHRRPVLLRRLARSVQGDPRLRAALLRAEGRGPLIGGVLRPVGPRGRPGLPREGRFARDSDRAMLAEQRKKLDRPGRRGGRRATRCCAHRVGKVEKLHTLAERLAEAHRQRRRDPPPAKGRTVSTRPPGCSSRPGLTDEILKRTSTRWPISTRV